MSFDPTTKFSDFVGAVDSHLAATLADDVHGLAGAVVAETGSNENGNWVKYGNGIMECWHEVNLTYASGNSLNTVWVFPQPFLSGTEPDVQLTLISHLLRGSIASGGAFSFHSLFIRYISNTQVQPQAQSATSYNWAGTDNLYVKCRAIGRWK